jgi:Cu2+-exporting ATPase
MKCSKCGQEVPADAIYCPHCTGDGKTTDRELIRGGSVNVGDPLTLAAVSAVGDSTLAAIVALQERASGDRPRLVRMADRAASWFVGTILILAVLTGVLWWPVDHARAFAAMLAVLVVTCPCALSLATPVALAAATARLARLGVLVTRADAIERLSRIDTVVLDKTGTLTVGEPRLVNGGDSQPSILATAAGPGIHWRQPPALAF